MISLPVAFSNCGDVAVLMVLANACRVAFVVGQELWYGSWFPKMKKTSSNWESWVLRKLSNWCGGWEFALWMSPRRRRYGAMGLSSNLLVAGDSRWRSDIIWKRSGFGGASVIGVVLDMFGVRSKFSWGRGEVLAGDEV